MYTLTFLLAWALLAVRVPATPVAEEKMLHLQPGVMSVSDQNDIVNKHNELRRGVQPTASNMLKMSWSNAAAANAQKWANGCSNNHSPSNQRTISTSGCGENIYSSSSKLPWDTAIQAWYDEVNNFHYSDLSVSLALVGHFTQVVWYRSNEVGCAVAHCPNAAYKYFYVCQYCPAGNLPTNPYKSGPSCGDCPNACDDKLCTNPCPYRDQFSNCPGQTKTWGCTMLANYCASTCKCTTEIV